MHCPAVLTIVPHSDTLGQLEEDSGAIEGNSEVEIWGPCN